MEKNYKISICMCTYNRPNDIKKTIESIINQTYTNWELIIVDDGGTDNTKEVVDSYNDNRIRYYWHKHNFIESRNDCLRLATGKYIKLIDSGDEINYKCLEILSDYLDKNENIQGLLILESNKENLNIHGELFKLYANNNRYLSNIIGHCASLFFKRELLTLFKNNIYYFDEYSGSGEDQQFIKILIYKFNAKIVTVSHKDINYKSNITENKTYWANCGKCNLDIKYVLNLYNKYNS